jgi:hypothetical protein
MLLEAQELSEAQEAQEDQMKCWLSERRRERLAQKKAKLNVFILKPLSKEERDRLDKVANTKIKTHWMSSSYDYHVGLKTAKSIIGCLIIRRKKGLRPNVDFHSYQLFYSYDSSMNVDVEERDSIINYRNNIALQEWNLRKYNKTITQLTMEFVHARQGRAIGNLVARYF